MCNFYNTVKWQRIRDEYRVAAPEDFYLIQEYEEESVYLELFARKPAAIITNENRDVATIGYWGIVPGNAINDPLPFIRQYSTVNARIEEAEKKPMYKNIIGQRCLIPAASFTEWQWEVPGKKNCKKHKHLVRAKDRDVFSFAGIYNRVGDVTNYTIFTTKANELMSEIHNNKLRMPVILDKKDEEAWLAGAPLEQYSLPYQVELEAIPADAPEPPPAQGKLF